MTLGYDSYGNIYSAWAILLLHLYSLVFSVNIRSDYVKVTDDKICVNRVPQLIQRKFWCLKMHPLEFLQLKMLGCKCYNLKFFLV